MTSDVTPTTPSIIVQLTDLHLAAPGAMAHGHDTAANLRRVAATVRAMDLRPDAILLTGDLSDAGDDASYEHYRDLVAKELEPFGCPVLAVLGNHDDRLAFRRVVLGDTTSDPDAPWCQVLDLHDVRLVLLDSHHPGHVTGLLGPAQLAWLDGQLAGAGDRPSIIGIHHPAVPRGVPRLDDYLLADRDAFAEVVARHRVAAVLCGHSHVATATSWAGTLHAAGPATAFLLDPSTRTTSRPYAGSGFAICTMRDGRAVVNAHVLEANVLEAP